MSNERGRLARIAYTFHVTRYSLLFPHPGPPPRSDATSTNNVSAQSVL